MPNEVVGFKINGSTYKYDHEELANLPDIDATPTANSTNAVQSGGVKSALDGIQAEIPTVDAIPTQGSTNTVSSGGVWDEIADLKEDLTDFSKLATGYNLINPSTIVDGEYWGGATATSANYSRTPLIAVKSNTAYTFANTDANYWDNHARARTIVFFTADETFISPRVDNTGNFTTPENCAFVGISFSQNARNVILIEGTYDITTQTMVYIPYIADTLKVTADAVDGLSVDNISDYKVTGKNLFDKAKAVSGFLNIYPQVNASDKRYFTSDYIPVKANTSYVISNDYISGNDYSMRSYVLYDSKHQKVSGEKGDVKSKVVTPTVDGYLRFCGYNNQKDRTQVEVGTTPTSFEPYKVVLNDTALLNNAQVGQVNNILYGKRWAVCGDSFTAGGGTGTKIADGKYNGRNYTYPWLIGNRNDMDILKFFEGGRTLAFPANPDTFTNSLTNPNASFYYQNIPADVDYITIYLGINDEHHAPNSSGGDGEDNTGKIPIGTVDDNTVNTYLGAWNVVLTWLITNRPNAHIGMIVTNGNQSKDEYRLGQIAIAEKYGIPYIDMNGDARTPAMLRTSNPNIPSAIKQALIQKWAVDPSSNTHPNDAAHLFESHFIENFLRSI